MGHNTAEHRIVIALCCALVVACTDAESNGAGNTTSTGAGGGGGQGGANAVELSWVAIPAGTFDMGCSPLDLDCFPDELPRHPVTISAFELAATELTQTEHAALLGSFTTEYTGCDACPASGISWNDANNVCAAAGGRLPTEAEWEHAARAGATTKYSCGDDPGCLDAIAWYQPNSGGSSHEVAQKAANAFGLFDMLGNVLEYVSDYYADDYYAMSPAADPPGPAMGSARVLRGGTWAFAAEFMRVSLRNHDQEAILLPSYVGVRCARDAR